MRPAVTSFLTQQPILTVMWCATLLHNRALFLIQCWIMTLRQDALKPAVLMTLLPLSESSNWMWCGC